MSLFEKHKFSYKALSAEQIHLASLAVSDVNKCIKQYESFLMPFRNKYYIWENGSITFVRLVSHTRPVFETLIALDSLSNKCYIPFLISEDLMALSKLFGLCDLREQVGLYLFTNFDYGVYNKHELPYEIATQEDLDHLEINRSVVDLVRHHENGETVWWNRWGGIVFIFCLKQDGMIFYEEISWREGKYKKRWFYPEY